MKPKVLVARAVFPEVIARLREHFDVETNDADEVWDKAELTRRLQGKVGAVHDRRRAHRRASARCQPATQGGVQHGGRLQQLRRAGLHRARRVVHQRARRADRNHGRLRLRADDGRGAAHRRERAFSAARRMDQVVLRHVHRQRRARRDARHPRHGPHRAGHRQARCARFRHAGDLSQPVPPRRIARSAFGRALRRQGDTCCARPIIW